MVSIDEIKKEMSEYFQRKYQRDFDIENTLRLRKSNQEIDDEELFSMLGAKLEELDNRISKLENND